MGTSERDRQLLEERDRILARLAELEQERRELQDRLTLLELELGLQMLREAAARVVTVAVCVLAIWQEVTA